MPRPLLRALPSALLWLAVLTAWGQDWRGTTQVATRGDLQQRLERVQADLARSPQDFNLRFSLAMVLADLGRLDESLAAFLALSEELPGLADPLNNVGVLRAAKGDIEGARLALEQALRIDPKHPAAIRNLADVYVRLALALWEGASAGSTPDENLSRKLQLARDLLRPNPSPPNRTPSP